MTIFTAGQEAFVLRVDPRVQRILFKTTVAEGFVPDIELGMYGDSHPFLVIDDGLVFQQRDGENWTGRTDPGLQLVTLDDPIVDAIKQAARHEREAARRRRLGRAELEKIVEQKSVAVRQALFNVSDTQAKLGRWQKTKAHVDALIAGYPDELSRVMQSLGSRQEALAAAEAELAKFLAEAASN